MGMEFLVPPEDRADRNPPPGRHSGFREGDIVIPVGYTGRAGRAAMIDQFLFSGASFDFFQIRYPSGAVRRMTDRKLVEASPEQRLEYLRAARIEPHVPEADAAEEDGYQPSAFGR